jgi:hypothetical protein
VVDVASLFSLDDIYFAASSSFGIMLLSYSAGSCPLLVVVMPLVFIKALSIILQKVCAWNMLCEQPYFQRLGCLIDILLLLSCGSNILIIKTLILCGDFFNKKQLLFFFVTFALILSLFFYIYILSKERHSVEKLKLKHKIIRERPQLEQVLKKEKKKRLRMYI